jgi:hypothetical protein
VGFGSNVLACQRAVVKKTNEMSAWSKAEIYRVAMLSGQWQQTLQQGLTREDRYDCSKVSERMKSGN